MCLGIAICLDAVLPTKKAHREISELQKKSSRLSGNHIIIFKDDSRCFADLDAPTIMNLRHNELVTARSTRFTRQCVYIEKNGIEMYRETYWRILFLAGAFLCIGYGIGKIDPENWWGR